ncbi:helix-turn-helix domain-containing protein [Streptomyces albipurpureus]|uniref:Helix-turn-helix domain-containing protein n=1 Tax=Streptomyces albipurpureus TaxID=2897419 RepID=A0ABT0UJ36_9ACTN|nr:helix-turn-helix transcriptional regulator [Streptomyces sp. CWNU-1]MCM2388191.1 helix-turn-helix domain-containing protein [Streptomyces sp. CWNU-1]
MGRRENPIVQCSKSLLALATWLRAGREEAGLTYHQLASHTGFSADTLSRAASGRSVPRNRSVVVAYAQACGRSPKEAERLWNYARRDEARAQGVLNGNRSGGHISVVKDFADLHSAIVDLYQDNGSPPLRCLDPRTGGLGRLPRSTVGRVLKGQSTPSRRFVLAFAEACGARRADLEEWGKAWDRADADRRNTRARRMRTGRPQNLLTRHDRVTPRDLQLLMSDLELAARKAPGLKFLVAIPDPNETRPQQSARMARELLVDQAQRRGELTCPQCRRPSLGYDNVKGWTAVLCGNCSAEQAGSLLPSHEEPPLAPSASLWPTPHSVPSAAPRPTWYPVPPHSPARAHPADTQTLELKVPPDVQPTPLPRRIPQADWPDPVDPTPAHPLDTDSLVTLVDPLPPAINGPAHPAPPDLARSETPLTPRVRIRTPGSRPSPTIDLRRPFKRDDD